MTLSVVIEKDEKERWIEKEIAMERQRNKWAWYRAGKFGVGVSVMHMLSGFR